MARVMMLRMGEIGGLDAGDEAGADLLLDEGVVAGEQMERTGAEEITAAVADVGEPEGGGLSGFRPTSSATSVVPMPRSARRLLRVAEDGGLAAETASCRRVWGWLAG